MPLFLPLSGTADFSPPRRLSPTAPCPTRAARAAAAAALPSGSTVCPATGLSNDQAAAIAENAGAITARIDSKAAALRVQAQGRAGASAAVVAAVAWGTGSAVAALAALLFCLLASAAFLARTARQAKARRAAHATVAKARAQAAAALVAATAAPSILAAPPAFDGRWLKDAANSDTMAAALDAVQLHGLVRRAVHLMRGLELRATSPPGVFQFAVFSALPWFRVTERYVLGGPPLRHRRRDLRRGGSTGSAVLLPPRVPGAEPRVAVDLAWADPHAGTGRDVYELTGPGAMTVWSEMEVVSPVPGGEPTRVVYVTRYKRK